MGRRTTQRILTCSDCGLIPDDGEYLWEMCGQYICEDCIDDEYKRNSTNGNSKEE